MAEKRDSFSSDAEWYCRRDPEEERFYAILFALCRERGVSWAGADEETKAAIEAAAREAYEQRCLLPEKSVEKGGIISPKTWDDLTEVEIDAVLAKSEQDIAEERVISQDELNAKMKERFASEQHGFGGLG